MADLRVSVRITKRFDEGLRLVGEARDDLLWETGGVIQDWAFRLGRKQTTSMVQSVYRSVGGYRDDSGERAWAAIAVNPRVRLNAPALAQNGQLVVGVLASHGAHIELLDPYLHPAYLQGVDHLHNRAAQVFRSHGLA